MLQLKGISKSYGDKLLFENLNIECDDSVILRAPSGWGKTTVFKIIMGLEKPDNGFIEGAGQVCPLFQEDRLILHLNAIENILLVCHKMVSTPMICTELTALGIEKNEQTMPSGRLSGGQRRRVALLRALFASGDTLLLDEPFTGLDKQSAVLAARTILHMRGNRTTLAAIHDTEGIRLLGWPVLELDKICKN